jgi:hypothetical protein
MLLPDYIDLDLKAFFDTTFRLDLLAEAASLSGFQRAEQFDWLRRRLAAYGAGSDPLVATAAAVAHLLEHLQIAGGNATAAGALQDLAGAVAAIPTPVAWTFSR